MPTRFFDLRDMSFVEDAIAGIHSPVRLYVSDLATSPDFASLNGTVLSPLESWGASTDDDIDQIRIRVFLALEDEAVADEFVPPVGVERIPVLFVVGEDEGTADETLHLKVGIHYVIEDESDASELVDFTPELPLLREPLETEVRGTVNLVRNPSLEYAGLLDWSGSAGATVALDTSDPWDGSTAAVYTIAAGTGVSEILVKSRESLGIAGVRSWIGSVMAKGTALDVRPFLRFTYSDATTEGAFTGERAWALQDLGLTNISGWWNALEMPGFDDLEAVASWPGLDSALRTLTQGTGAAQPSYVADAGDGLPAVRFGGNDWLSRAGFQGGSFSYAGVWKVGNPGVQEFLFNSSSTVRPKAVKLSSNLYQFRANSGAPTFAMSHGAFHVTTGIFDALAGPDEGGGFDGQYTKGNIGSNPMSGNFNVGVDEIAAASFLLGDIRQLLVAPGVWSDATRQLVEGALAWESGIPLAVGHPYELDGPAGVGGFAAPVDWGLLETESQLQNSAKVLERIDLVLQVPQWSSAQTLRLDGAQIEEDLGDGATMFADGDQGAGHRWYGTPGFSVSVREPQEMV